MAVDLDKLKVFLTNTYTDQIVKKLTGDFTVSATPGAEGNFRVAHGLDKAYIPFLIRTATDTTGNGLVANYQGDPIVVHCSCDNTYVNLRWYTVSAPFTTKVNYLITLIEP